MWLELALDHRCNLRCLGCHACDDDGTSLAAPAVVARLVEARARGVERLWLGGGEPTLRDDLLRVVATARRLGFRTVCVQTNGLRLAYPRYLDALLAAGVDVVRLNLKSHDAAVHDALCAAPGAHALLLTALAALRGRARVVGDLLVTTRNGPDLGHTVAFFAARGVEAFSLWWLSAADDPAVAPEVPRIGDLHGALADAARAAEVAGAALDSFHTPPCTLPAPLRSLYHPVSELSLEVIEPSNHAFALERSSFEGGAFLPDCSACSARPRCLGPRADYLRRHGEAEFVPLGPSGELRSRA